MNKLLDILNSSKNIHFIGIGGSGMCPIAEVLRSHGYNISGSDNYISDTLQKLINDGVKVFTEHNSKNINNADIVVYSAAIKDDNPEMIAARNLNIPTIERSTMLGLICSKYKNPIAISGTHGKTSTTAMITQILTFAQIDPSAIIGGKLPFIGGNSRIGKSETIICEACEYVDSFLKIYPSISIILNIEADHLDYFKNLDNIIKSFHKFASQTSNLVIINGDDKNCITASQNINAGILTFGMSKNNDYYIENLKKTNGAFYEYTLMHHGKKVTDIKLSVPGKHNVLNSLAAAATAHCMGIEKDIIKDSLMAFHGVHRRFEILGNPNNITIADDFAHHPTEIKTTLETAMSMGFNHVFAVFQPHTYSRTAAFLDSFASSLSIADTVVLSEILAVREKNIYNIYSEDLAAKMKNCVYRKTFEEITDYIEETAKPGDLVLTMGGGNVYVCANMILDRLSKTHIIKNTN